jgi:SPFH domain / Band 7 family
MFKKFIKLNLLLVLALTVGGCDLGFNQIEGTQTAVIFRQLPTYLGGGIANKVAVSGSKVFLWPWEKLVTYTTNQREISWGPGGTFPELLAARSSDGNEVAFLVNVRYQLSREPKDLVELATKIAPSDENLEELVLSEVRALVRQYVNKLATREIVSSDLSTELLDAAATTGAADAAELKKKNVDTEKAFEEIKAELQRELSNNLAVYKVKLEQLVLANPRFVRYRRNEQPDDTYQEKLVQIQSQQQAIQREKESRLTDRELKGAELERAETFANRKIIEARADAEQTQEKALLFLQTKGVERDAIEASGQKILNSMRAQIEAVAGEGGRAILKLDLAKELRNNATQFILVNENQGGQGVSVNRTDTNDLIKQLGLMESMNLDKLNKVYPSREKSVVKSGKANNLIDNKFGLGINVPEIPPIDKP